jgi:hypothetical protein
MAQLGHLYPENPHLYAIYKLQNRNTRRKKLGIPLNCRDYNFTPGLAYGEMPQP